MFGVMIRLERDEGANELDGGDRTDWRQGKAGKSNTTSHAIRDTAGLPGKQVDDDI